MPISISVIGPRAGVLVLLIRGTDDDMLLAFLALFSQSATTLGCRLFVRELFVPDFDLAQPTRCILRISSQNTLFYGV